MTQLIWTNLALIRNFKHVIAGPLFATNKLLSFQKMIPKKFKINNTRHVIHVLQFSVLISKIKIIQD